MGQIVTLAATAVCCWLVLFLDDAVYSTQEKIALLIGTDGKTHTHTHTYTICTLLHAGTIVW